jgi:hypothetical protein
MENVPLFNHLKANLEDLVGLHNCIFLMLIVCFLGDGRGMGELSNGNVETFVIYKIFCNNV